MVFEALMIKKAIVLFTLIALTGCATVFTGQTSNIQLRVIDADTNALLDNVSCSITDNEGMVYFINGNPGSILANKGKGALRVDCKKPGYTQQNMGISQNINGVTFVNVLFWPGFIVDAISGSMHKYPAHATIQMKKSD